MDKNDFSESLGLNIISEIRKDIEKIGRSTNKKIIKQLTQKVDMLEKIITVSTINENQENNNNISEPDNNNNSNANNSDKRKISLKELAENNGKDGKPAYVAYRGVVYDVSNSELWAQGLHFGLPAGREQTIEYTACHAGRPRLEGFPIVGILEEPQT